MMDREKQIEMAALEEYFPYTVESEERDAYILGAKWADAHPHNKVDIEKACNYLQKNLWQVAFTQEAEFRQRFVTDFRVAMEEGSETDSENSIKTSDSFVKLVDSIVRKTVDAVNEISRKCGDENSKEGLEILTKLCELGISNPDAAHEHMVNLCVDHVIKNWED